MDIKQLLEKDDELVSSANLGFDPTYKYRRMTSFERMSLLLKIEEINVLDEPITADESKIIAKIKETYAKELASKDRTIGTLSEVAFKESQEVGRLRKILIKNGIDYREG